MLSYQPSLRPHFGQTERPRIDFFLDRRQTREFKKLPIAKPKIKVKKSQMPIVLLYYFRIKMPARCQALRNGG